MKGTGQSAGVLISDRPSHRRYERVRSAFQRIDASFAFAGIVVLAIAMRFDAIGARLTIDDAYSWLVASSPSAHAFLRQLAASENSPPLFYLLLSPLPIDQPGWLRVPSAVPGILICVVLYYATRRALGDRAALLAALAVAVSPLLVTYSDFARGFMVAGLALLVALWAVLKLVEAGSGRRWWAVYLIAGVAAVYTEYDSAIFLVALTTTAVWIGKPARPRMALLGPLPIVTLVPWIPQLIRAQHQVNVTKLAPTFPGPSLTALRDIAVTLALGENGGTANSAGRWAEFILILGLAVLAAVAIRRSWTGRDSRGQHAILLIAGTAALTLAGHAIAGAIGIDLFNQRYLTILIPLGAALTAAALTGQRRSLAVTGGVLLLALGAVGLVRRYQGEWEPPIAPVRSAALAMHPRTVLTNNPVILYYLAALRPQLDRPYNLGPGRAASCRGPCLIIDDSRVPGGTPRQVAGTHTAIGPYVLTLEP